jgi:hypothetical protein
VALLGLRDNWIKTIQIIKKSIHLIDLERKIIWMELFCGFFGGGRRRMYQCFDTFKEIENLIIP